MNEPADRRPTMPIHFVRHGETDWNVAKASRAAQTLT